MSQPRALPTVSLPQLVFGRRFAASRDCDWHTHEVPELVLVTEGRCTCTAAGQTLLGEPGTLWILPAQAPQYQRTITFTRTVYLGVKPVRGFSQAPRAVRVGLGGYIHRWMDDLVDLHQSEGAGQRVTGSLLAALLGELDRLESRHQEVGRRHPAVEAAMAFIEQHLTHPLSAAEVGKQAHVSASHLTSLFRREVGVAPLQYQTRLRLRLAAKLLQDPHASVKQVAFACGYSDCNYFVRLFRRHHALPPNRWRQQSRQG